MKCDVSMYIHREIFLCCYFPAVAGAGGGGAVPAGAADGARDDMGAGNGACWGGGFCRF